MDYRKKAMKARNQFAAFLIAISVALPVSAGVVTVLDRVSAASGSSGPVNTSGARTLNLMVCGVAFDGVVTIKQGPDVSSLATTKTLTLTGHNNCSEYYTLNPATIAEVDYTRTAGSLTVKLEYYE